MKGEYHKTLHKNVSLVLGILISAVMLTGCEAPVQAPASSQSETSQVIPDNYVVYGAEGADMSEKMFFLPCQKEPDFAKGIEDDCSKIVIEYYNYEYTLSDYDTWSAHFQSKMFSEANFNTLKESGQLEQDGISSYEEYKEHIRQTMGIELPDDPVLPAGAVIFLVQAYKDDEAPASKKLAVDGFRAATEWLFTSKEGDAMLQGCADLDTSGGVHVLVSEQEGYVRVQIFAMAGDKVYEGFYRYENGGLAGVDDNTGISIFGYYE